MQTAQTTRKELEARIEDLGTREAELVAEAKALGAREAEAQTTGIPARVHAVLNRGKVDLPKELRRVRSERWAAVEDLKALLVAEAKERLKPHREELAAKDAEMEEAQSERQEIQSRVWAVEGEITNLERERWYANAEKDRYAREW